MTNSASRPRFRFVDLFAGLGGFHVALKELGGHDVFAAEWEPALNTLYTKNFELEDVWKDVSDLKNAAVISRVVPDHDVLTAGFPCQPFSKAGEQLGFEHTLQGQLFFKVFNILKVKKPRHFILENVPNILRHRDGKTLRTMIAKLEGIGYAVKIHRYSPHDFGIPQVRERAYFVGSLDGLDDFQWPKESDDPTDIRAVIDAKATEVRGIPKQTDHAIDMWDDFLKRSPAGVKLPSFPIWSMEFLATYPYQDETPPALWKELGPIGLASVRGSFGVRLDQLTMEQQHERIPSHARRAGDYVFPRWKQTFIKQNREFYQSNMAWIDPWLAKWRPWDLPSSLQKFEWNAQGGERRIDAYVLQVRASGIRVKRTKTAPSLIAMTHTQVPILGADLAGHRRYMTPNECAKLQSLDGIALPKSDLAAYKALGNAVNARVVQAIAEPLLADLITGDGREPLLAVA
ncbi:DNA (cytosine-5)-methyltransferase 1 [Salinibacterium sp. CAN_S4]|uniref:DNA cytosine methyltransferase n=1 Tax=Salinibacterium sp. CAN_S4 TaxID=2787727 RepID=UPI0018F01809